MEEKTRRWEGARVRGWSRKGETGRLTAANRLTITHSIERVSDVVRYS